MTLTTEQLNESSETRPPEELHCKWESYRSNGFKFWRTACGDVRERLQEICDTCGKRVWLTGFDAWWEARKGYHP
jgi:hypothetical protein